MTGRMSYSILFGIEDCNIKEVTFKDILAGTGQQKEGYRKIEFCRKRAASDGLQHGWVDTCYIDKSNSTGRSDAINSMRVEESLQSTWRNEFRESRWLRLGDKGSLEQLIHEITGIAIGALRKSPLSDSSIGERMSWSKGRQRRQSLLILMYFNVHMPLVYGEGEQKASNCL
ncbi:hypothetical protein F4824DRAFT_488232 [Ustulina deusta]|nr:hypothetical protein F4823DRAFT_621664 [Ustulina deusta]KAI3338904.1 hypothetical protein F4824DRAFT_488232 [Ustulina deusta]